MTKSIKANKCRVTEFMPANYMTHVNKQVANITRLVGVKNGEHYLNEALKSFPEEAEKLKQP